MTNYSLAVVNIKSKTQYDMLVETLKEYDLIRYAFDDGQYYAEDKEAIFDSYEELCWSAHVGHMILISEAFPKMTFRLECSDDHKHWREYYKDGDYELCVGEIVFEKPRKIKW